MLIQKNHLSLKRFLRILHAVVFCHNRVAVRSYILWLSTCANLYVPNGPSRLRVVQNCHATYIARQFGSIKTLDLVTRSLWWPHMRRFVEDYVRACDTCCRIKIPRHHPCGLLYPLPNPSNP